MEVLTTDIVVACIVRILIWSTHLYKTTTIRKRNKTWSGCWKTLTNLNTYLLGCNHRITLGWIKEDIHDIHWTRRIGKNWISV